MNYQLKINLLILLVTLLLIRWLQIYHMSSPPGSVSNPEENAEQGDSMQEVAHESTQQQGHQVVTRLKNNIVKRK